MKTSTTNVLQCDPGKACRIIAPAKARGPAQSVAAIPGGIKKILVPVDFSPRTRKALKYALSLATDSKARVALVCATAPVSYETDYGYGPVAREIPDENTMKKTTARLKAYARRHVAKARLAETMVRSGEPVTAIVRAATELEIDRIVICTHRQPRFGGAAVVSIAEQLIHNSPCLVIVLHEE